MRAGTVPPRWTDPARTVETSASNRAPPSDCASTRPVTMASSFDSLASTGSPGAGLIFDHVSGSFTSLVTTVTGSTGPAIAIKDSEADFDFGATTIVDPLGDGVVVTGTNGDIAFGDTDISGLGAATGVDVQVDTVEPAQV